MASRRSEAPDRLREMSHPEKELTSKMLEAFKVTETGEELKDPQDPPGTLSRIPSLQGATWLVDTASNVIIRYTGQPREDFDEEYISDLRTTIQREGQKVPVNVVPFREKRTGKLRLLLVDGECRFRAVSGLRGSDRKPLRVNVDWVATEEQLFKHSVLMNEGRRPHNPLERAKYCARLIRFKEQRGMGKQKAMEEVAQELGKSLHFVQYHLKLLELHPDIQRMVIRGEIPPTNLLQLPSAATKFGKQLDQMRLAAALLEELKRKRTETTGPKSGRLTREEVSRVMRGQLIAAGHAEVSDDITAAQAIHRLLAETRQTIRAVERLMEVNAPAVKKNLLERPLGEPAEVLRDRIVDTRQALSEALGVVERAIAPPPLDIPQNKSSFEVFIQKHSSAFRNEARLRMALELAKASDAKIKVLTVAQLSELFKLDANTINSNIPILEQELRTLIVTLERHTVRERDSRGQYDKKVAYRLNWASAAVASVGAREATTEAPKRALSAAPASSASSSRLPQPTAVAQTSGVVPPPRSLPAAPRLPPVDLLKPDLDAKATRLSPPPNGTIGSLQELQKLAGGGSKGTVYFAIDSDDKLAIVQTYRAKTEPKRGDVIPFRVILTMHEGKTVTGIVSVFQPSCRIPVIHESALRRLALFKENPFQVHHS